MPKSKIVYFLAYRPKLTIWSGRGVITKKQPAHEIRPKIKSQTTSSQKFSQNSKKRKKGEKEMSKKLTKNDIIKTIYKETGRTSLIVYLILRALVILCMILQIIRGDINNALLCLLSLILLILPLFIQNKFQITLPNALEISIYLFIFSAEILGEINNFYERIPYWDTILHTINGFLATAVGFSLIDLLNKNSKKFNLSPIYLCLVAFCFSMTIGVMWEFFEYSMDKVFLTDMQKDEQITTISTVTLDPNQNNNPLIIKDIDHTILYDKSGNQLATINNGYLDIGNNDTMKDLFVNFLGAIIFCFFGYFYLKDKKQGQVITNFVPQKGKRKLPASVKAQLAQLAKENQKKSKHFRN